MFELEFNTNNDAFTGPGVVGAEVANILRDVAVRVEQGADGGTISDINGNTVGHFRLTTD